MSTLVKLIEKHKTKISGVACSMPGQIDAGNEAVLQVMRSHFRKLAIQIYNLQVIYDPEKIAIGGGISRQPLVLSMIQEGLDEIYEKRPRTVYPVNLVACEFRSDANLIGALHYHLEKYRCEEREL